MSNVIAEFFYEKTSQRVNLKWGENHLSQDDIVKSNRKLFSHVINCKITGDNPYLLTPTSMSGIRKNLGFKDDAELMFGTRLEIEEYAEELFGLFFDEYIVASNDIFPKDTYQIFYCDYLPYAKNCASLDLLSGKNLKKNDREFREALLNTTRKDLIRNLEKLTDKARHFVYLKNRKWFLEELFRFTDNTPSYIKFPKRIDTFAKEIFVKKIKENIPTGRNSLGIRTKELFESDLAIIDQELRVYGWQNDEEEYKYKLFSASLSYINNLEKIFMRYHHQLTKK